MAILGLDEVGRGPWAGPLVIGAVILKSPKTKRDLLLDAEDFLSGASSEFSPVWDDLTDSKALTRTRREDLAPEIEKFAFATGLGWVSSSEVDELGLAEALRTAAKRAVVDCLKHAGLESPEKYVGGNQNIDLSIFPADEIIIDGTVNFLRGTPLESRVSTLKKADLLIKEVSAASIIAKVARDNYMINVVAKKYPEYGFENHVGYGTKKHQEMLNIYGPCPEHRVSVRPVSKALGLNPAKKSSVKDTSEVGRVAEEVVAEYLRKKGHKILAHNYKTKFYEIDLISATKDHIYFTEVKYRKSAFYGTPLETITKKKQRQMYFAAEAFLDYLGQRLGRDPETLPSPVLAAASVAGKDYNFETWLPLV